MKKIVALLLALVMALGCGVIAVSADSGSTGQGDPSAALIEGSAIAEMIAPAANKRYFDPRHTITAEDIYVFDFYQFQDSPAFAVYFYVKELCYIEVMLEERVGDWLLVSSHPEPFLFFDNKLYGFKEAYEAGIMTDAMLSELAASDFTGGSRVPILTPYPDDGSYVLPGSTLSDSGYQNGEIYVSIRLEDKSCIAAARSTVKETLKDYDIESVSILLSYEDEAIFRVTLADKEKSVIWSAIAELEQNPAVNFAKPNRGEYSYSVPDDFVPGVVLVCGSGFEALLQDFEIESVRALTSSFPDTIYKVTFAEKSTDVVWRALEILEKAPDLKFACPDFYTHVTNDEPVDPQSDLTTALWESGAELTPEDIVSAVNEQHLDIDGDVPAQAITIKNSYRFKSRPAYIVDYDIEGYTHNADAAWEEHKLGDFLLYTSCAYEPSVLIGNKLFLLSTAYLANILTDEMMKELIAEDYKGGNKDVDCRIVTLYIKGDADGDGGVSVIDATVIQRYEANIITAYDFFKPLGDVDGDNDVSIIDATLIQRSEAGLYTIG